MTSMVLVGKQQMNYQYQRYMYQTVCLSMCLFANSFNAKGKCKLFHQKTLDPYLNSSLAIFHQFRFIKKSNSLHSLYVRVKICVMTY